MFGPLALLILQTCVIIVAARVIGVLARRVGQPAVIAEVLAGICLGPSLLGRVSPAVSAALFPKASLSGLSLLSQVGLVFFMFLIGLELDPKLLRGRGASSFAISASGIFVPFTLGALFALHIFAGQAGPRVPKASFTLFMGIAMSITAFPVLARILAERKLIRSKLGSIALACAAADDVTAWCLLAFVVSFVHANGVAQAFFTTVEAASFAAFMLFVVRPALARLGARITTRENLTQNVVALTFVLLLASAFVSEWIGIHALFGAFLCGAIMPRQGDYAHALAERMEDFVVVALLPLFFAFSGLRTELGLVAGTSDWLLCFELTTVACLGKFGGSFAAGRLTGMTTRDAAALGVLMNTRGLMELIVLNIGLDLGVISPKIFTMMVLMALVTTVMTTPLLKFVAPRASLRAEGAAPGPAERVARLLLCIGDAGIGPAMASLAASCAGGAGGQSDSVALHLERPRERTSHYLAAQTPRVAGLGSFLETAAASGLTLETSTFDSSDPARDICEAARAYGSDYVVLGLHRPVLGQNVFGGIVGAVLAQAPAPVALLIDRGLSQAFARDSAERRVLVAASGGVLDARVLAFAEQLLKDPGVTLSVLLAELVPNGQARRVEALAAAHSGRVAFQVEPSAGRHGALLSAANQADLVIIGLDAAWGLGADGLDAQAARLVTACPASLIVIHERLAAA